jgi:rod shape-determining protein MreC
MRVRTRTWFSFVVIASMIFILGSRFGVFNPLQNSTLHFSVPVETGLRNATRPLADFVNNLTDTHHLSKENQSLRQENEKLQAQLASLRETQTQLNDLEQFMKVRGVQASDTFLESHVFAQSSSNARRQVAIDRGTSDGVQQGMVVLTREGSLIGSVTRALSNVSWVTLIADESSAVSAKIQGSGAQGVVAGSLDGTMSIEFVSATADVKEADLVVTSGVGGRHPPGEIIGKVTKVQNTAQELFKSVQVQPLADFSHLENVIIVTSFVPKDAGTPP